MPTRKSGGETPDWDRFTVALYRSDADDLKQIAAERGLKYTAVVREAVLFWLRAQQKRRAS